MAEYSRAWALAVFRLNIFVLPHQVGHWPLVGSRNEDRDGNIFASLAVKCRLVTIKAVLVAARDAAINHLAGAGGEHAGHFVFLCRVGHWPNDTLSDILSGVSSTIGEYFMIIRGYSIAGRTIAMIVGAILLVVLVGLGLNQCQGRKTAEKQAEVAEGQAGAAIDAGAEAVNTAAEIVASDAATDAQVAAAQAEIRAATTGQKGKAAKRAACRFKAYRDTPQCQEPKP